MKLRAEILPQQGIYTVTISLDGIRPLSGREVDAVSHLGDPVVDFGGDFADANVAFTLAANEQSVPASLPVSQQFDLADYADAAARAQCWASVMLVRIGDAMAALVTTDVTVSSTVQTVGGVTGDVVPNDAPLANWMQI